MVTAATNWPTQGDIRELMNRGQMNEATAIRFMGYNGVNPSTAPALLELRKQLLSPADAALAVLRGNMSEGDGLAVAAANGVSARDFKVVTDNTGEPLGLMQLLEAYRRHIIDRPRLVTGILQSRVRNDWIDVAEALRYGPMSTADAVNAVVQNQMPAAMAAEIADQNGLMPGHIDYLEKTAGEPLSRTEMEQLFNRGLVTEAEVIQALRESRLKNKYNADAFKLHVRMPEGRQIVSMITHGALTKAAGTDLLLQLGYSKQVAAALILEGTSTKLAVHHSLTLAEIRQLYADRIFTQAHCLDLMLKLGYDDADAHSLLSLWDLLAGAAMVRQAAGVIRSRYVGHKIDDTTAKTDLALLGVGAAAVARYIKVWAIERKASVKTLSEAQIVKAHKSGLLNLPDALKRLAAEGYDDVDSHILLGLPSGKALP
jgi:hypothetical protein